MELALLLGIDFIGVDNCSCNTIRIKSHVCIRSVYLISSNVFYLEMGTYMADREKANYVCYSQRAICSHTSTFVDLT